MKKIISLVALIAISLSLSAQTDSWVRTEVGNGLSVVFPNTPKYQLSDAGTSYTSLNSDCIFITQIIRDVIKKDYDKFVLAESKWSEAEKKNIAYSFLDNYAKSRVNSSGGRNAIYSNVKIGNFYGKKIEYTAVNPINGKVGKRYMIALALLKYNKIYSFECLLLDDTSKAMRDKNTFFNSIK